MILEMVNSRNGEQAEYKTTLEVIDLGDAFKFIFYCEHTGFFCPLKNYNDMQYPLIELSFPVIDRTVFIPATI